MRSALKTALGMLVPIFCALGVILWLARARDVSLARIFAFGNPYHHVLAAGAALLDLTARALRTHALSRALGIRLGWRRSAALQLISEGASAVTPARAGGEPAKFLFLNRRGVPVGRAAVLSLGEALSEALAVGCTALLLASLFSATRPAAAALLIYPITVCATAAAALLCAGRLRRRLLRVLVLPVGMKRQLAGTLRVFATHARQLRSLTVRPLLLVAFGAFGHISARALVLLALLHDAIPSGARSEVIAWPLAVQYGSALIPVPGGGGGAELGITFALQHLLPAHALVPALLWWRIYTFYAGALVGVMLLLGERRQIGR